jgi:hypothetical protein
MKKAFVSLETAAKKMYFQFNQEKTQYMTITTKGSACGCTLDSYKFKTAHNFTYLGSEVNCKNNINTQGKKRIIMCMVLRVTKITGSSSDYWIS